ncbi:MAG: AAA family ATPase [Bacilli bacterium]|jgi:predicted kinase
MQSNRKTRLILIGGDIASGKSTFARKFSREHNLMCITKDRLKEILADQFGFKNRKENYELSKGSFQLIAYFVFQALDTKTPLVVESNFRQYELDEIEELARKYNGEIVSLVFVGEPIILYKRYLERIAEGNRHIAHQCVDFRNEEEFTQMINKMHEVRYPGKVKIVDNTYLDALNDMNLYNEIGDFLLKE